MKVLFKEISLTSKKSGKCLCGKYRYRSKKFYQTLNPWNKNKDGEPKSRGEIIDELREEIEQWQKEQITCDECELINPTNVDIKE